MTSRDPLQNDRRDRGQQAGQRLIADEGDRQASDESFDVAEEAAEEEALDDDEDIPVTEEDR